jgi:hypothetical protein
MKPQHLLFAAFAILAGLSSCKKEIQPKGEETLRAVSQKGNGNQALKENTFYGHQVQVGNGKARSYIRMTHAGTPLELGIEMTEGAMAGLGDHLTFVLPLHQKALKATAFDHIYVGWNEGGHPPIPLFGVPHFDFHFMMMSSAARMAIPDYTPGSLHDLLPAAPYWPAGFVPTPGGEVVMGKHWVDVVNPVFPNSFTHTMIYGSYNGKMNFVEPMITRAFLQSGADVSMSYGQPAQYHETGTYYPTMYNITDKEGKHYISLSNFVLR